MPIREDVKDTSGSCGDNGNGHNYGPCACCVALAQVRFPHYHHDAPASPSQYPYAAGYPGSGDGGLASRNGNGKHPPEDAQVTASSTAGNTTTKNNGKKIFVLPNFAARYLGSQTRTSKLGNVGSKTAQKGDKPASPGSTAAAGEGGGGGQTADGGKTESGTGGTLEEALDDVEVKIPKPRRIWHGLDGAAVTLFGILLPGLMLSLSCLSMPKRLTLVLLNHPLETLAEMALVAAIPLFNYFVWKTLVAKRTKFVRLSSAAAGLSAGSSLLVAGLCVAGLFTSNNQSMMGMSDELGPGLSWLAILSMLAAAASAYIVARLRASRDFASTKRQVAIFSAAGALTAASVLAAAEARPWAIRMAEHMATSGSKSEQREGLDLLRKLYPERELRMECSDPRAAGISGMFIPVKASSQHQLYFMLTGKPYSFREFNNTDMSSMPDDYLSRNVVGEPVAGLALTRSTIAGNVHARTMAATLSWTFVFKNDTAQPQEARAEIGLPPGAVVTGLTTWNKGESKEASFMASGKADGVSSWNQIGHDSPAIVTDLGHGRILMHCYPIPQDQESKLTVKMVMPLNPDRTRSASMLLPKFIATNFGLSDGEHSLRLRGEQALSSGIKALKPERLPGDVFTLSGTLTDDELKSNKLLIDTQRSADNSAIAVLDPLAWQMAKEEQKRLDEIAREKAKRASQEEQKKEQQVVVMVDGSKGINLQLDAVKKAIAQQHQSNKNRKAIIKAIPARYVTEAVERVSAAAPKHLVVVVDGSATAKEYKDQIRQALAKLPAGIPATFILASQESDKLSNPQPLSKGLDLLKNAPFVGGQDNLKAVVKAAELAGDTRSGAVLWIHGPQPALNQEIYIMSAYASTPAFYEMTLGSGETDSYEFFKNHPEIGPFTAIPRNSSNIAEDMTSFFARWSPQDSSYALKLAMTTLRPDNFKAVSKEEGDELLILHAAERCNELIAAQRMRAAATVAINYGFVSPVSSAVVSDTSQASHESDNLDAFSNAGGGSADKEVSAATQLSAGASENPPAQPAPPAEATSENDSSTSSAPMLQGATNSTIGPSTIQGVNTAGTVRVNNLANLEALLNIIANLCEIGMGVVGLVLLIHGMVAGDVAVDLVGHEVVLTRGKRIAIGAALIILGMSVPGIINWFVASARDANLFS